MKLTSRKISVAHGLGLSFLVLLGMTGTGAAQTIENYNDQLVKFGVAWDGATARYLPSFYTGFAPKEETANRIHFHLAIRPCASRYPAPEFEASEYAIR